MNDVVNHPAHYTDGKIEVIDFIEDKGLNFHRGNAVKYISRAGKKDPSKEIEDLEKAVWYLRREIERLRREEDRRDRRGNGVHPGDCDLCGVMPMTDEELAQVQADLLLADVEEV